MTLPEALARAESAFDECFDLHLDTAEAQLIDAGGTPDELDRLRRESIAEFVRWKRETLQQLAAWLRADGEPIH